MGLPILSATPLRLRLGNLGGKQLGTTSELRKDGFPRTSRARMRRDMGSVEALSQAHGQERPRQPPWSTFAFFPIWYVISSIASEGS